MDFDYPKVRALTICIECRQTKRSGQLICHHCHTRQKRTPHHGGGDYDTCLEATFDLIEAGTLLVTREGKIVLG